MGAMKKFIDDKEMEEFLMSCRPVHMIDLKVRKKSEKPRMVDLAVVTLCKNSDSEDVGHSPLIHALFSENEENSGFEIKKMGFQDINGKNIGHTGKGYIRTEEDETITLYLKTNRNEQKSTFRPSRSEKIFEIETSSFGVGQWYYRKLPYYVATDPGILECPGSLEEEKRTCEELADQDPSRKYLLEDVPIDFAYRACCKKKGFERELSSVRLPLFFILKLLKFPVLFGCDKDEKTEEKNCVIQIALKRKVKFGTDDKFYSYLYDNNDLPLEGTKPRKGSSDKPKTGTWKEAMAVVCIDYESDQD